MTAKYQPPVQGRGGQITDSLFVMVLVFVVLLLPLLLGGGASQYTIEGVENPTWQTLGQNETQAAQWVKLGYTPEEAKPLINTRFDYSFNAWALFLTIAVIVGYFIFMLKVSDKEYRDVVAEAFDGDGR